VPKCSNGVYGTNTTVYACQPGDHGIEHRHLSQKRAEPPERRALTAIPRIDEHPPVARPTQLLQDGWRDLSRLIVEGVLLPSTSHDVQAAINNVFRSCRGCRRGFK